MKTLTLLRHAKSSWDDTVPRDFDRPLNAKGHRAAKAMGAELKARGLTFDAVMASPAVRVKETLVDFSDGYGAAILPAFDSGLYLASVDTLLDEIQSVDDGASSLLIVGHNPGLEMLAMALSGTCAGNGALEELERKYPTATVAQISFQAECWADVKEGSGTLTLFLRPRDIDPALGPDAD